MTAQNFMNVVRFKLKSDCVDKYFQIIDKTSFEGMTQRYIAKTGNFDYCFVGIWKSSEAIAFQRPAIRAITLNKKELFHVFLFIKKFLYVNMY